MSLIIGILVFSNKLNNINTYLIAFLIKLVREPNHYYIIDNNY